VTGALLTIVRLYRTRYDAHCKLSPQGSRTVLEVRYTRGVPAKHVEKLRAMLTAITEAANIREVERYSGWRLHPLRGDRRGTWGMVLTRNQRITFVLRGSSVENLDVEDYH